MEMEKRLIIPLSDNLFYADRDNVGPRKPSSKFLAVEVDYWLTDNNIKWDYTFWRGSWCIIFNNDDDAALFKIVWG